MSKNVLLTGGTGFIGKNLTDLLIKNGYTVSVLSRRAKPNTNQIKYYKWDTTAQLIDENAVLNADIIINLAGENIAEKKMDSNKKNGVIKQ